MITLKKVQTTIAITLGAITLLGLIYAGIVFINGQVSTISVIAERTDLSIDQDKIDAAEGDVRWIEVQATFERREQPPSAAEEKMLELEKKRLEELRELKRLKEQMYQSRK